MALNRLVLKKKQQPCSQVSYAPSMSSSKISCQEPSHFLVWFPIVSRYTLYLSLSENNSNRRKGERRGGGGKSHLWTQLPLAGTDSMDNAPLRYPLSPRALERRFADERLPETWPGKTGRCIPQRQRILRYSLALCFRCTGC